MSLSLFESFLNDAHNNKRKGQRMGQSYANCLHAIHPELYAIVQANGLDPFYNDKIIPEFLSAVSEAMIEMEEED